MSFAINSIEGETTNKKMVFYFAVVFFFFNSFLLPGGVFYTSILTPVLFLWLFKQRLGLIRILLTYVLIALALFCVHVLYGIDFFAYTQSSILLITCLIFILSVYAFFKKYSYLYDRILEKVTNLNFIFVIVALLALFLFNDDQFFWIKTEITELLGGSPRLKLLTSEASVYSFLLSPIFFYYFQFYYFNNFNKKRLKLIAIIILSLSLSLSYSVIAGIVITLLIFVLYNFFTKKRRVYNHKFFVIYSLLLVVGVFLAIGPLKDTGVVLRIFNILSGTDTSTNGRSFESYMLANKVLDLKNSFFGIGPGQFKIDGNNIVKNFYGYSADSAVQGAGQSVRLPSSVADCLVTFGYVGVIFRFVFEFYLFYKTKVINSAYHLCIFIFVFILQFISGNVTSINEYFLWVLAFSNAFPDNYFKRSTTEESFIPQPETAGIEIQGT